MNRIKGTLLIAGVAAAFAVSVACSSGESSSTPGTQPAPVVPAARIEPQMPVEPVLVAPPASNQPLTQNQPVSLPPVFSGQTVEIPSPTASASNAAGSRYLRDQTRHEMVVRGRFELPTPAFSVLCSTN